MKNLSKNKKLNYVLNDIYNYLIDLGKDEIRHYMKCFKNKSDYNIYQYGNMRIYNLEIIKLYKDYKSLKFASFDKLIEIYKSQVGYVARLIVNNQID